jgi:hypothetical protein
MKRLRCLWHKVESGIGRDDPCGKAIYFIRSAEGIVMSNQLVPLCQKCVNMGRGNRDDGTVPMPITDELMNEYTCQKVMES